MLDDFRSVRLIGIGGFGCVYSGVRKADDRRYAIKMVEFRSIARSEGEQSLNEIRFLASFRHPFIIKYYDSFFENDKLYIVMEFAQDGDLGRLLKKNGAVKRYLPESRIWSYFLQILLGVHAMHKKQVIHRDIKSRNIFLCDVNHVCLGDLGCSKHLCPGESAHTKTGTPYYMSPELIQGRPYGSKSDIWSLGVVLYEMVSLSLPFTGKEEKEVSKKILQNHPRVNRSHCGPELQAILDWCLRIRSPPFRTSEKQPAPRASSDELLKNPEVRRKLDLLPSIDSLESTVPIGPSIAYRSDLASIALPPSKFHAKDVEMPSWSHVVLSESQNTQEAPYLFSRSSLVLERRSSARESSVTQTNASLNPPNAPLPTLLARSSSVHMRRGPDLLNPHRKPLFQPASTGVSKPEYIPIARSSTQSRRMPSSGRRAPPSTTSSSLNVQSSKGLMKGRTSPPPFSKRASPRLTRSPSTSGSPCPDRLLVEPDPMVFAPERPPLAPSDPVAPLQAIPEANSPSDSGEESSGDDAGEALSVVSGEGGGASTAQTPSQSPSSPPGPAPPLPPPSASLKPYRPLRRDFRVPSVPLARSSPPTSGSGGDTPVASTHRSLARLAPPARSRVHFHAQSLSGKLVLVETLVDSFPPPPSLPSSLPKAAPSEPTSSVAVPRGGKPLSRSTTTRTPSVREQEALERHIREMESARTTATGSEARPLRTRPACKQGIPVARRPASSRGCEKAPIPPARPKEIPSMRSPTAVGQRCTTGPRIFRSPARSLERHL